MNVELAEEIARLAAPIFAALIVKASVEQIEDNRWQREARAAAIRQASLLWNQTLRSDASETPGGLMSA